MLEDGEGTVNVGVYQYETVGYTIVEEKVIRITEEENQKRKRDALVVEALEKAFKNDLFYMRESYMGKNGRLILSVDELLDWYKEVEKE